MEYNNAKSDVLYVDGSLRDIFIPISGADGYRELVAFLYQSGIAYEIAMDGQTVDIDSAINEFAKGEDRLVPKLSFAVSEVLFICHFFDTEELEIDFAPKDVSNEVKWNSCVELFNGLSRFFQCPIQVHPESERNEILYEARA